MSWHKYNAKRTTIDGEVFDSKSEALRHQELLLLERAGEISNLRRQVEFILQDAFVMTSGERVRSITIVVDWMYEEDDHLVLEDRKGMETEAFKIKWKLLKFRHPECVFRITGGKQGRR